MRRQFPGPNIPLCSTISAVPHTLIALDIRESTNCKPSIAKATLVPPSLTFLYLRVGGKCLDCGFPRRICRRIRTLLAQHPADLPGRLANLHERCVFICSILGSENTVRSNSQNLWNRHKLTKLNLQSLPEEDTSKEGVFWAVRRNRLRPFFHV